MKEWSFTSFWWGCIPSFQGSEDYGHQGLLSDWMWEGNSNNVMTTTIWNRHSSQSRNSDTLINGKQRIPCVRGELFILGLEVRNSPFSSAHVNSPSQNGYKQLPGIQYVYVSLVISWLGHEHPAMISCRCQSCWISKQNNKTPRNI